ncbi:PQQ-binding-like beta-propeller repeat protein [Bradyrhizobium sp. ISRA435]|nr:PQQ-binding-like beta-propeller repeat protein [Bradyrhizobium sp. ISRA435]
MTRLKRVKSHMLAAAAASAATIAGSFAFAEDVSQERLLNADKEAGNWLHHHKDYAANRFSTLNEINHDNVKNLKVAWTMALGGVEGGGIWSHGGLEGTPIVENGFMYVTDGWGSVYKIDAHGGKGVLLWKMDPKTDHDWAGAVACCGVDNRGVALWSNLVISHTLDGRLIATNKETGQVAWQRQVADPDKGEVITGAPLIVKDMAITGVAGAEIRHSRLDRCDRPEDPEGSLAHAHDPGQGRSRPRDLEGRQERRRNRRWIDLGHRQLRPVDQHDHLGRRQSRPGLG